MLSLVRVSEEEMSKAWILSPDPIKRLLPMNRAVAVMNYKTALFLSFVLNGVGYPFSVKTGERKNISTLGNFKQKSLRDAGMLAVK